MTAREDQPVPSRFPRQSDPRRWRGVRPWTRHSLVLAVAGAVYVLVGVSYILTDPTDARRAQLRVALSWTHGSLDAWGVVWLLVGAMALVSARWPPASETWGYTAMTGLSAGWSGFYLAGDALGADGAATGALVWGLVAFLWWAISGLVNPAGKPGGKV